MKSEVERLREAVEYARFVFKVQELTNTAEKFESLIAGEPEYKEVDQFLGWLNIYADRAGSVYHPTEGHADEVAKRSDSKRLDCREIIVKVKVPKEPPKEEWIRVYVDVEGRLIPATHSDINSVIIYDSREAAASTCPAYVARLERLEVPK